MISNCSSDENGRLYGGKAGDQTGKEWRIRDWYNRPWTCVLRHPDPKVRETIADLGEKAAKNDKVGYDQYQRTTYWTELQKVDYDPSKIKTACESDCSAGVCGNVKATGYILNIPELKSVQILSTHSMRAHLKAHGFIVLTDSKYLKSDDYLLRGDILLYDGHHTATNLTNGSKSGVANDTSEKTDTATAVVSALNKSVQWSGYITKVTTPRVWAGTENDAMKTVSDLKVNTIIGICDTIKDSGGKEWYYCFINNKSYGFVPAQNVSKTKVEDKTNTTTTKDEGFSKETKWVGKITANSLNIRVWPGTENATLKSYPYLTKNTKVNVCDEAKDSKGNKWYYIEYNKKYGFASAKYITKA